MAEAVVGLLIGKLGEALVTEAAIYGASLLCKESSTLVGLFGEMRKAKAELEIMQAYLHHAEKFKDTNETTDLFVKKIRGLAFRIEDVVDEFMYMLQDKHGGLVAKMKKRIKHVKIWRRLALELQDINTELEDTMKRRDRYAMPEMERHTGGSGHHDKSINQTLWFAREEDLVGIDDSVETLTRWLVGDLEGRRNKIVTVWGMGGVGKTTLVHHVYKIVKTDFENAAWVTVTRSYDVEDLLKNIARAFGILEDTRNMELRNLVEFIHNFLGGKRYILVLDDVWDMETWIKIMDVFPSNCTSRIVLTSRKYEVASLATSNFSIKLEPLEENDSWKLFCNLAFRNDDEKRCPLELESLAAKFLQKCEGLPLAIACIGRLLSCKSPIYSVWENLYEELELQSNNNVVPGVDIIFKVSLEDLPYELKNCFLHCSIFPEDYGIHRRRLIKHWITAGFIKEKEHKILEQVAEGYLNELVNRSLLQVVEKNETGRIRCCRMHDIVRRLALDKAEKECFGKVYEGSEAFSTDGARRLTINSSNITLLCQSGVTHLRAIHAFTSSLDIDLLKPIISSSNLLSTLDLQGTQIKYLPNDIFSLFNLRLLGLRYTGIEVLPEALGRLKNLEVLDAHGTCLRSLPKNIAKLKKLRFLYASGLLADESFARYDGIKVPSGIKNLTGLHALQTVKASVETLRDIEALRELRTFSICDVRSEYSLNLCNVIMNMRHLAHLSVRASSRNEVLPWEAHTLPETLCKLRVRGQLEKKQMPGILSSWSHLKNLTRLSLILSKLDEDSFCSLATLHGLRLLRLTKAYDGKKLCFSPLSFPGLQRLEIRGAPELSQVEIEEGALESLVELEFSNCPELKHLPHGIEYLKALEELRLEDTAEELIEKLRKEVESNECNGELMRISHIKKVVVKLTKKKLWERIR